MKTKSPQIGVDSVKELQKVFDYEGQLVRSVIKNGEPWFVAKDTCEILDIDTSQTRRIDDDEKGLCLIQTPGGSQEMICVNEPGLYSLILGSRKPEAKTFKRWVTHEVLPSIRKTGKYSTQPEYQNESLRAAMEIFRGLDINNMKATDRAAFFRMVSKSFSTGSTHKQAAATNARVDQITKDAEMALNWVKHMYAKHGSNEPIFGIPNGDWFLIRRSHWRKWAEQNQLNLTTILKELHRQGVVKKFYKNSPRYSRIQRVEGVAVHLVWVKREFIESDGPHLSVVKS